MSTTLPPCASDWWNLPLTDLLDEIVARNHSYVRRVLDRLNHRLASVAAAYGLGYGRLQDLAPLFVQLENAIRQYIGQEEQVVFPQLKHLSRLSREMRRAASQGSIDDLLQDVGHQQSRVVEILEKIRHLTDGYRAPPDASFNYRAALLDLAELDEELSEHFKNEGSILFSRAQKLQSGGEA